MKLERSNDITLALQKKDSLNQSDTSVPNNRLSGRKGSNTSKNYREETSEEEEDDEQGTPSKGKKGKIFKTKENVKDKRKSTFLSYLLYVSIIKAQTYSFKQC